MSLSDFIRLLEDELQVPAGSLTPTTRLADLPRFDSMGRLSFMAMVDDKLGIIIDPDAMARCQTVADLHTLVQKPAGA